MDESKIKHLGMIQHVITRMNSNSFILKGWTVTLVVGTFALLSDQPKKIVLLISFLPIFLFWFLDSYYLQLERRYRMLYQNINNSENIVGKFEMIPIRPDSKDQTRFYQSLLSKTELGFYLTTALLVTITIVVT